MDDFEIYQSLPHFLRSYIDGKQWKSFREVQIQAFDILNNSENHLLISSGTSSGKTEAAFFPVLSDIYRSKPKRISVLYISPLIALIDDQHDRLSRMISDSGIDLFSWHGDVSSSVKRKALQRGEGILQITPESLENVVHRYYKEAASMFSDLRYVIIDEVHSFMNSDRGLHLLCELESIEKLANCRPRRIGLSATLSDFNQAVDWLRGNSGREVSLIDCPDKPDYELKIRFNKLADKGTPERQPTLQQFYQAIYDETYLYNCLVFTNNRTSVENTVVGLKKIDSISGTHKEIWAHHSSISKGYREEAEEHLKDPYFKCTAIATSTLELGIDIGDLDRVVHINAPYTVSSMVQKFGRSGRRTGHPIMVCICNNMYPSKLIGIESDLIKAIAESELFFNEHWIEPVSYSHLPYSLLFQQTLSYVRHHITASHKELYNDVLDLYPFRNITKQDYQILLNYLCSIDVLDYNRDCNSFILGSSGDHISRQFDFGTNFKTIREFNVFYGKKLVGTIQSLPDVGDLIQLAGNSWQVSSIDQKMSEVLVIPSNSQTETFWKSGLSDIHTRVYQGMYECLCSDQEYDYLDESALNCLKQSRSAFNEQGLNSKLVIYDGCLRLFPWVGTVQFDTLYRILEKLGMANSCQPPYSILIKEKFNDLDDIRDAVYDYINNHTPMDLVTENDVMNASTLGKYNRYIPDELLRKQFVRDRIDFSLEF